jgi:hypothetical protein
MAVAATNAIGQGQMRFHNYGYVNTGGPGQGTYVPIEYSAGLGGAKVGIADGVTIQLWGAPGNALPAGSLLYIADAAWSAYAGYTDKTQVFNVAANPYTDGQVWTVQLRAAGTYLGNPVTGAGDLFSTALADVDGPGAPGTPGNFITAGFEVALVPEPTTFALAGLGAAALLIFRRRD